MQQTFRAGFERVVPILLVSVGAACAAGTPERTGGGPTMASASAPNQLTTQERAAGWRLLFDGRTLNGWRGFGQQSVPAAHWEIVDGAIRKRPSGQVPVAADGQPVAGGDLITVDAFNDYELAFEWKVTPGANSGLKYNVDEQFSLSQNPNARAALGFEYQVLDDAGHPDAKAGRNGNRTSGGLYDLIAPAQNKPLRPVGEWNQARVVFRGNHGEHWLNGVKVVDYDLGTARMDSLFRLSKWSDLPQFITRKANHRIVLQDHNDEVFYRNIKIRELR